MNFIGKKILYRGRPDIHADPRTVGPTHCAELHRYQALISAALGSFSDQHFVVAHAAKIARIKQRHAAIKRFLDGCNASALLDSPYMPDIAMHPSARG